MNNINQLINETKKFLKKYDYNNAIKCCDKILEIEPNSYFGLQYKGISYYQQGNYECGLKYYEKLQELFPNCYDCNETIAFLNEQLGNYETAIEYYDKSPKCTEIENKIKRLLSKIKKYDIILSEYERRLESLNKHQQHTDIIKQKIVLLEEKAVYLYRCKKYTEAIESFDTSCQLYNSIKEDIYNNNKFDKWYALLENYLKKYDEYRFFDEIFNIDNNFAIWSDKIKGTLSQFEDPLVFTDILLEIYPDNIKLLEISAKKSYGINTDYSKDCLKKILDLEPENTTAIYQLLDIYSQGHSKDKQLQLIDSKLYIESTKIELLVRKIRLLESMTLYEEALETYDEYLNIEKPEGTIHHPLTVFDKIRCMEQYAVELYSDENYDESFNILKEVSKIFNETEKNMGIISIDEWNIEDWYTEILRKSIITSNNNSIAFFNEFYKLDNKSIELWIEKIKSLIIWNKFGNPITYCNIFLNKYPQNTRILETKAYIYYRTSRLKKSLDIYNELSRIQPINNEAKHYKFNILVQHHKYMKSYKLLQNMNVNYKLIYYYLKQLTDALIHYRKYNEAEYCLEIILKHDFNMKDINKLKLIWNKTNNHVHQNDSPYYLDWINLINYKHAEYVCPNCGGKLIPIKYGLIPINEENESEIGEEYVLGGCCVNFDSPTDYCKHCQKEIHMGTYGIDISKEDYDLYLYTHRNIEWLTNYLEKHPEKTIKQIEKESNKCLSLNHEEYVAFIEKLENINFIEKDNNHLILVEGYKKFHNAI